MGQNKKTKTGWRYEFTDPHFLLTAAAGFILISAGLYLLFTGSLKQAVYGLVIWSYGILSLGFSVGFNFGKYGK